MGSVGNQNPWSPYESYRDCSQGICNTYCPQWCYAIFPPPPPFDYQEDDSNTTFSPLIIAIIAILASAFLLVSYYTIVTKYCRRRRSNRNSNSTIEMEANRDEITRDHWQVSITGLDETLIKSITVCKYVKGDGLIEGTECSVCLNEFQENESLRLLPKCTHAFHLPCIDTWLKTHSNCPLCRSNAAPTSPPRPPPPAANSQNLSSLSISALEIQRGNDLVLVVDDRERSDREEVVVSLVIDGPGKEHVRDSRTAMENAEMRSNDLENENYFRRSISLGTFSSGGGHHRSIAEILKTDDDDDDLQSEICQSFTGVGSSMKRSVSTERFIGKNSIDTN